MEKTIKLFNPKKEFVTDKEFNRPTELNINTIYAEPLVSIILSLKESHIGNFSIKLNRLTVLKEEHDEDNGDIETQMNLKYTTHTYHVDNRRLVNCVATYIFKSGDYKVTVTIDVTCSGSYVLPELDKDLHKYCYTYIVGILKLEPFITSMYESPELSIPESLDIFEKSDIKKYDGYSEVFSINSDEAIKIDDSNKVAFFDKTTKQI